MKDLDRAAEQVKLARLLEIAEESLPFIVEQPSAQTRAFRETVAEFYYQRQRDSFSRLAGMSKILPIGASAKLALNLLGAVLSAGIACELPPERAAKLADKLPSEFLAKLALYLDPLRAGPIIGAVSEDNLLGVAKVLNQQREYVTLARFVPFIRETTLAKVIQAMGNDGEASLRVAMYVEDKSLLDKLVRLLSDTQRVKLLEAAANFDLWPEMLSLLSYLKDDMKIVMANLAGCQDSAVREKLIRNVVSRGTWEELFEALALMNESNLDLAASLPSMQEPAIVEAFIAQANKSGMDGKLNGLIKRMTAKQAP